MQQKWNEDMKKDFDIHQGHGNHNSCLCEPEKDEEFLSEWIPRSITESEVIGGTKEPIACNFGDDLPKEMPMLFLGDTKAPLRLGLLLAVKEAGKQNTLVSVYPEHDGAEVRVKITAIHEWAAGVEATLEGEVLDEAAREIAFFDTRYALNKGRYKIGKTYVFRLSAFAYSADVLPEENREFRFEGEDAVKHRERCGLEQEYDEAGKPKPVVFRIEGAVAFLPKWGPYPDDAEFQSPAFGDVSEFTAFGTDFYRIHVAIARDEEDVVIPLIARKSLFSVAPKTDDPVYGMLWLQGYCPDVESAV